MSYRINRGTIGALALAWALGCSAVSACERTGVRRERAATARHSSAAAPGHSARTAEPNDPPPTLPQTTPAAWARWWQSWLRPPTQHHVIQVNGRRIELFREALLPGWHYPYTDAELEAALCDLPPAWLARLQSVRLTFHPEWDALGRTDGTRIEISYVVDDSLCAWGKVDEEDPEEVLFGARLQTWGGARYVVWPDRDALRIYLLRHVLIHELGHQVAPPNLDPDADEAWAEAFAYRYYTPPAGKSLAALTARAEKD